MSLTNNKTHDSSPVNIKDIKDIKKSVISDNIDPDIPNVSNLSLQDTPVNNKSILPSYIKEENNKMIKHDVSAEVKPDLKIDYTQAVKLDVNPDIEPVIRLEGKQEFKIKRCPAKNCSKRLGVSNIHTCKCGIVTCIAHRFPEDHSCTIDYKKIGREQLTNNNPVIVANKLQKI